MPRLKPNMVRLIYNIPKLSSKLTLEAQETLPLRKEETSGRY